MPVYKAPVKEIQFIINKVFSIEQYQNLNGYSDLPPDLAEALLDEGARFCEEVIFPLNQEGDKKGCQYHNEKAEVVTPKGYREAYEQFCKNGWPAFAAHPEYGGQGLPYLYNMVFMEFISSANMAWGMYPGLTHGAYSALFFGGDEDQKKQYLPSLASGKWTGTMNLTETHCGTDLGLLKTKAVLQKDGSYKITGSKIFISAGEHDLAENIIHLVLARIEGAPEGVKGISLFCVPKYLVNEDGSLGERNTVKCGSIEKKMGIHGNSTCVMNFDSASASLVGEENKGLKMMFIMMNEARIGVGLQGLSQSEIAYQNALQYAKDRLQGRSLTGIKNKEGSADPIIVHPDIRRILMDIKAFNESARALLLYTALQVDLHQKSKNDKVRETADDLLSLLTPIVKGFITDKSFLNTVSAQQVFGGHGYIEEWGMSQYVRDSRITMIYEGANGIQALDLVGRKLARNGGRAIMNYFANIDALIKQGKDKKEIEPYLDGLKLAKDRLQNASMWLMQYGQQDHNQAGAVSTDYMYLFGYTLLMHMWVLIVQAAQQGIENSDEQNKKERSFYQTKLHTARYFLQKILPETAVLLEKIQAGADTLMILEEDEF